MPTLIDRMLPVDDADSIAAMRELSALLGRKVGPSTGTNFVGMLAVATEMQRTGEVGSIVSLLCDAGERYLDNYHDVKWVQKTFGDCAAVQARVRDLLA